MIKIGIDASGPHAAVDAMLKKLSHFRRVDIGQEMSEWQVQDMHRNKPFTMRSRAKGRAATVVRPHSLYEVKKRARPTKKYERAVRRLLRGKKVRKLPELPHRTSTRPYLRAVLYNQLQARMQRLLKEKTNVAPVNFAADLLEPDYAQWSRNITITPVASQPAAAAYGARGIYGTQALDLLGEDTVISTQQTIIDIIETEFTVLPQQGDRITIPADGALQALGEFEVVSTSSDGGGETTLVVREWEATP